MESDTSKAIRVGKCLFLFWLPWNPEDETGTQKHIFSLLTIYLSPEEHQVSYSWLCLAENCFCSPLF